MEIHERHREEYLIYNRKSTDDTLNQKNSLLYQRTRNLEFAQKSGFPIAQFTVAGFCEKGIVDESHSGFKEDVEVEIDDSGSIHYRIRRPKFLEIVKLLNDRKIKGVIFLSWDRASRNKQDSGLIQKLMKQGVDIRFSEATYDKSSAGDLHMDIDGMFAAHYSRVISEKVHASYRKLRAEGKCVQLTPIGYLDRGSDNKPLDPERAPIVKRIFEMYSSGEWSFTELAKWANEQGLTKKPMRAKRTREQVLANLDINSLQKIARSVDHKTIEYILRNPFYIGRIRDGETFYLGKYHTPLIDTKLFNRVQQVLRARNKSVHYIDKTFFAYRGLLRCPCGRAYTPYEQKGAVYYRSNCKGDCENTSPNMSEEEVNEAIQKLMDRISFTPEELADIEAQAKPQLAAISETRDKKLADLYAKQHKYMADLDYLAQNRISLMRAGGWSPEGVMAEETRLNGSLKGVHEEIRVYGESASEMLKCILTFSELVKNAGAYFRYALDTERRDMVTLMFYEITINDKNTVDWRGKDGFGSLLQRVWLTGDSLPLCSNLFY